MKRCIVGLIIKNIAIIKVATNKTLYNVIRAVLDKRFCNLRRKPIVLFILHCTVSRCLSKYNILSRMISRCSWDVTCITLLWNTSGGCDIALDFRLNMTSCACFLVSGLKLIFHWNAHLFIFAKSLFSSRAEVLLSWITENKEVSSANSLAFEDNPSDKSLIYIKNNNGLQSELPHNCSMRILILSWPCALLESKFCSIFAMSSMEKFAVNMRLTTW